jgi:hypothetical protein
MIRQILALVCAAALLCGCVLQSRVALYGDADAKLVLGESDGTARTSSRKDGKWLVDDEGVNIKVVGRHYTASAKNSVVNLHFVPLDGSWFTLQATEAGKPAVYMLAEVKSRIADIRPISCSELKNQARLANWIAHEGDDCFIMPGAPATEIFATLLTMPGETTTRIELLP